MLDKMVVDASSVTDMEELVEAIQDDDNYQDCHFLSHRMTSQQV